MRLSISFANGVCVEDYPMCTNGLSEDAKDFTSFLQESFTQIDTQANGNKLLIKGMKGSGVVDVRVTALDLPKDKQPIIRPVGRAK